MVDKELPEGWKWVKLSQISEVVTGNTPPKSDKDNYGDIYPFYKPPHLWDCNLSESEEMLSQKGSLKARLVPANTVLVTCIGNLGRTGFTKKVVAFNQQINAILENKDIIGKYIFYSAQSPTFRRQLEKLATGTTVSIVNKSNFQTIKISLPPNKETQQAIVSKIEELFSELDKGIENLKTAQEQLKVYRQSVLKWAFEGKLTSLNHDSLDLPDEHDLAMVAEPQEVYQSKKHQGNQGNPKDHGADKVESPEGWKLEKIENVINKLDQGWSPKCLNEASTDENEWAVIKTSAIQHGYFQSFENKILPKNLIPKEQHELVVDDILITRAGPRVRVGVCCLVRKTRKRLINCDKVYRIKLNQSVIRPQYFELVLNSPEYQRIIEQMKSGISDSGLNISQNKFLKVEIPLPPLGVQTRIVEEIESRLSVADKMEQIIQQSLLQAESLRQSILKKAFEGELVS